MSDNRTIKFAVNLGDGEEATVFSFDMKGMMPNGRLTTEGRMQLEAQMLAAITPKVDPHRLAEVARSIGDLLDGAEGKSIVAISGKALLDALDAMLEQLANMPNATRSIAISLGVEEPFSSAPNIYSLGQASASMEGARAGLTFARRQIANVLCHHTGHCDHETTPPEPQSGAWS